MYTHVLTQWAHQNHHEQTYYARIEECKEDEQLASVNAKYNRKISKGAKRRAILGGVISFASGIGGFIVGAVLAPFTLGGSVAVSAAYGVAAGVNISAAVINGVNASECTDRADLHESTAKELRDDIQRLEEECEKEEKEMERLMSAIDMGGSQSSEVPGGGTEGYHVLRNQDNDTLKELLKSNIGKPVQMTVYSSKTQAEVQPNSPADLAGLKSNTDYIIGADSILHEVPLSNTPAGATQGMANLSLNTGTPTIPVIPSAPPAGLQGAPGFPNQPAPLPNFSHTTTPV
ncbi:GORS2-like protein, partial [Mya arenaria]